MCELLEHRETLIPLEATIYRSPCCVVDNDDFKKEDELVVELLRVFLHSVAENCGDRDRRRADRPSVGDRCVKWSTCHQKMVQDYVERCSKSLACCNVHVFVT